MPIARIPQESFRSRPGYCTSGGLGCVLARFDDHYSGTMIPKGTQKLTLLYFPANREPFSAEWKRVGRGIFMDMRTLLRERFNQRTSERRLEKAKRWFEEHYAKLEELGKNRTLQGVIFGPLIGLLDSFGDTTEGQVRRTITQVALANAVLAGLPGKLGVGIFVCMALEGWMAYRIASHVGLKVDSPSDIFKTVGLALGAVAAIVFGFVHVLRTVFSLLSFAPAAIPATALAELITTNFFGLLFWFAFQSVNDIRKLDRSTLQKLVPKAGRGARKLAMYQRNVVKKVPDSLRGIANRLWYFLQGKYPQADEPRRRGELMASACMAHMLEGRPDAFDGPLGDVFLQSIRDTWKGIEPEATAEEIAHFVRSQSYTNAQLDGAVQSVKGKMFELLVARHENADGDEWIAHLHADQNFPGSDVVLTNTETGQEIALSLKATSNPASIESALLRYPDIPILTTSEWSERYVDDVRVDTSNWSETELKRISRGNWNELAQNTAERWETVVNVSGSSAAIRIALLWPLVVQTMRRGKRS